MWWTKRSFDFRREERKDGVDVTFDFLEKKEKSESSFKKDCMHLGGACLHFCPTINCQIAFPSPPSPVCLRARRSCILPMDTQQTSTRVGWRRHLNNGCGSWRGTPGSKTKWGGLLAKTRPASRRTPRASRHNDPAITKTRLWIKLWINHDHPLKGRNLHRRQDKNVVVSFHS